MFRILGEFTNAVMNKPLEYFQQRDTFLDCRGKIICDETAMFGFNVTILTMSHDKNDWSVGVYRDVVIGKNVFICSNSLIYNSHIGNNAIIACGTVVRSRDVPENCMVEGNPAVVIAVKHGIEWVYLNKPYNELPIKNKSI